jgi:hypothetical protein
MKCASCDKPIVGNHIYHYRLDAYVHSTEGCMRDVRGEDIRAHAVMWIQKEQSK